MANFIAILPLDPTPVPQEEVPKPRTLAQRISGLRFRMSRLLQEREAIATVTCRTDAEVKRQQLAARLYLMPSLAELQSTHPELARLIHMQSQQHASLDQLELSILILGRQRKQLVKEVE